MTLLVLAVLMLVGYGAVEVARFRRSRERRSRDGYPAAHLGVRLTNGALVAAALWAVLSAPTAAVDPLGAGPTLGAPLAGLARIFLCAIALLSVADVWFVVRRYRAEVRRTQAELMDDLSAMLHSPPERGQKP